MKQFVDLPQHNNLGQHLPSSGGAGSVLPHEPTLCPMVTGNKDNSLALSCCTRCTRYTVRVPWKK